MSSRSISLTAAPITDADLDLIPRWMILPAPVVIVTPARGREAFAMVRPLMRRLREITQGGVPLLQMEIGGRCVTETTCAAVSWYLENMTFAGLQRAMRRPAPLYSSMTWAAFLDLLDVEFLQP